MSNCHCAIPDGYKAPRRGTLAREVESREMKRREQEAARFEVEKFYTQQKAFDNAAGNPLKEDIARKQREAKERNKEGDMLQGLYEADRTRELALIRAEEEEKIATALARRMHDKDRAELEVQHLRGQSHELRELTDKIKQARVAKERTLQVQEKVVIRAQQQEYDTAFNQYLEANGAAAAAREQEAVAYRREQAVKAREVLEDQMQERQDMLRVAEQEAARERLMVDEVVRRIQEEDAANAAHQRQQVTDTKAYIARFLEDRTQALHAKRQADETEDKKIQDYWSEVRAREAKETAIKAERKEVADRMYEKVKREMEDARRLREEEEELINMLRQEEAEEKRQLEDDARRQKAEMLKRDIQRANQYQMQLKVERDAAAKADEEEFRRRMMAKFADDDRLEQLNQQKRRMKQVEHSREVQRLIDERRQLYAEQKARDEAETAAAAAEEGRKAGIIEGERRKLLREAAELRDFLPRGVLRDQADVDYVNQHMAGLGR